LASTTSLTAPAARSHPAIAGTVHPSSGTARDGAVCHATRAWNRTGSLMSYALISVPSSDKEHGCTICKSSHNGAAGNNSTGRVDLATGTDITAHGAAVTSISIRGRCRVSGSVGGAILARCGANGKRTGCVNEAGQIVNRRVFVVPKHIGGVAKLCRKLGFQIARDGEQSQSRDEPLVLCRVQRL